MSDITMKVQRHRFKVGERVRPSKLGIERNIFSGTYRGVRKATASGTIVRVGDYNTPVVLWSYRKTSTSYWPTFISPDRRKKRP